jgi:hypothetical protein
MLFEAVSSFLVTIYQEDIDALRTARGLDTFAQKPSLHTTVFTGRLMRLLGRLGRIRTIFRPINHQKRIPRLGTLFLCFFYRIYDTNCVVDHSCGTLSPVRWRKTLLQTPEVNSFPLHTVNPIRIPISSAFNMHTQEMTRIRESFNIPTILKNNAIPLISLAVETRYEVLNTEDWT